VTAVLGDEKIESIEIKTDGKTEPFRLDAGHLFLFLGALPCTDWLKDFVAMDSRGFIKTGADLTREELARSQWPVERSPTLFETSQPRVYAVGDCRSGSVKRVASAVGEGSIVVQFIHRALSES
jgi:thioredoxin reductase (NADPH)